MSFAIITISGNITRDAEAVNFKSGNKGAKLGIAVNDSKEHTSFYDVLFSEDSAVKFLLEKGTKGSAITIVGDLVINIKDDKTFVNVYGRSVVELFNRKANGTEPTANDKLPTSVAKKPDAPVSKPTPAAPKPTPNAPTPTTPSVDVEEDDFPF